ncbi:hypothetical protein GGR54DRAFT_637189 [Hypoxylon sp. NC1633]|nr:hypothetical protein GGR54DRAFT_637189 [Hypoxylon sp. NC1633]
MPSSNGENQAQDTQLWTLSRKMARRPTLQPRGSPRRRGINIGSTSDTQLRPRLVVSRDGRDGDDNDHKKHSGWDFDGFPGSKNGPGDGGKPHSFNGKGKGNDDGEKDRDGDKENENNIGNPPPPPPPPSPTPSPPPSSPTTQPTQPSTTSSSSLPIITTLTPLPPNQTTQPGVVTVPVPNTLSISTTSLAFSSIEQTPSTALNPVFQPQKEQTDMTSILPPSFTSNIQQTVTSTTMQRATETTSSIGGATSKDFSMGNDDNNNDRDGRRRGGNGNNKDNPSRGLDPTAEHLLIAAGAIGAFILFCFVGWIVYRAMKRSKGQPFSSTGIGFIDKFSRRKQAPMEGTWDSRTLNVSNEAPPLYEKGEYGPGKAYPAGPGSAVRSVASNSEAGTLRRPLSDDPELANIIDQHQSSNQGEAGNSTTNLTMRSQMPQPYYDESELARQPPGEYIPAKRLGNRSSALSSISSGFGDGDIIIPPPLAVNKSLPAQVPPDDPGTRDSWMSREGGQRETVYTTTSEDRPARFRSIGSWVNQQAGRAKRAGSRARERGEVPVMPAIPGEISVTQQTAYR